MTELTTRRRLLVLLICCMSVLIVTLDSTVVNLALPSIRHDLHASVSGLQWIIDAYLLVLASLLMLSGSTADRIGRRRVFQAGLTLFCLGSLLCSMAPGLGWLVAFRMVQAVGGCMLNPVAMSIIANAFPEERQRARAIGVWGGAVGISMALGPVVGGLIVATAGWRWIFLINVPIGTLAFVLTTVFVPESRAARPRRADPVGQALVLVTLATLTYGIIEGPGRGWGAPPIVGCFLASALGLVALLAYESRRAEPLLELRFFRSAPFSGATVIAVCAFAALASFLFLNALYLQEVRGYSAVRAGIYTLPAALMMGIGAPVSGRLVAARGPRTPLIMAGLAMGTSAIMLTTLTAHTPLRWLMVVYVLFGIGQGVVNAPITTTAVSGMPRAQAGVAAAVASTSRQVGQSLGVAVVGSAVTSNVHGPLRTGFAAASHLGWWVVAACALAVLVVGIATTGRWARATAAAVAGAYPSPPARVPLTLP